MEGEIHLCIDSEKIKKDSCWDGLKGYITNSTLSNDEAIENYRQLWHIEKAFRISDRFEGKTNLSQAASQNRSTHLHIVYRF